MDFERVIVTNNNTQVDCKNLSLVHVRSQNVRHGRPPPAYRFAHRFSIRECPSISDDGFELETRVADELDAMGVDWAVSRLVSFDHSLAKRVMRSSFSKSRDRVQNRETVIVFTGTNTPLLIQMWLRDRVMGAIETNGLTKQYGDVTAVDSLNLVVDEGTIFGFLGPNGAGKSTVINCLLDYIRPTEGQISVLGHDAQAETLAVRKRTGILPQGFDLYDRLTGRQHLEFIIDSNDAADDPETIADRVGIADAIDRRVGGYSRGMTQRLVLGTALIGQPDLLVLDEPSTGLDPEGAHEMREIVREEADRGATVFFSSHILSQVEAVCDEVGILQAGKLVAEDTIDGLRTAIEAETTLTVAVDRTPDEALAAVRALADVSSVSATGTTVTVQCADDAKMAVLRELEAAGATVEDFDLTKTTLEDLFLAYTDDETGASAGHDQLTKVLTQ